MRIAASFAALALSLAAASPALAHAHLLSASPAADAKASNVRTLSLAFSEALIDKLSGVDIVMTGMPGMDHHSPMKVSGFQTALANGGKTLTATLPRALPAGSYQVTWHAVTSDTHRIEGTYSFSVK